MGTKPEKEPVYCASCLRYLTVLINENHGRPKFIRVCANRGCELFTNVNKFAYWRRNKRTDNELE